MRLPEFVLGQARSRGAKPALIEADSGRQISYERLAGAVSDAAQWLAEAGVGPGDVVALCAPGGIKFVIAWYAASSAGAVITTVSPAVADDELISHLWRAGTRWLVTTDGLYAGKLAAVAGQLAGLEGAFVFGPGVGLGRLAGGVWPGPAPRRFDALGFGARAVFGDDGAPGGGDAAGRLLTAEARFALPRLGAGDVAFLAPSSGATGPPKIAVLTHRSLIAGLQLLSRVQHVTERDVTLTLAPLARAYGLQGTLNPGLLRGATVVVLPRFEPGAFLRAVQDYRVTRADVVPAVVAQLATSELAREYDLSSLRLLTSATAPLGTGAARACAERLGIRVVQAFEVTEAGGATHFGLEDGPDYPDSIGRVIPGVECRVVDPATGQDRERGELMVRTQAMMRGYLDDPAATAAAIDADGWLHTGDIVTVDTAGWYRLAGSY